MTYKVTGVLPIPTYFYIALLMLLHIYMFMLMLIPTVIKSQVYAPSSQNYGTTA